MYIMAGCEWELCMHIWVKYDRFEGLVRTATVSRLFMHR